MIHRILAVFVLLCAALDMPAQKRFPWRPAPQGVVSGSSFACTPTSAQLARRSNVVTPIPLDFYQNPVVASGLPGYEAPWCDSTFGTETARVSIQSSALFQLGAIAFSRDNRRLALKDQNGASLVVYGFDPNAMVITQPRHRLIAVDLSGSWAPVAGTTAMWSMRAGEESILYFTQGLKLYKVDVTDTPTGPVGFERYPKTLVWDFSSRLSGTSVDALLGFDNCSADATTARMLCFVSYSPPAGGAAVSAGYFVFNLATGATVAKFLNGVDSPNGTDSPALDRWQEITLPRVTGGSITVTLFNANRNGYKGAIDATGNYLQLSRTGVVAPTTGTFFGDAPGNSVMIRNMTPGASWTWKIAHEVGHGGIGPGKLLGHDVSGQILRLWDWETLSLNADRSSNNGTDKWNFASQVGVDYATWNLTGKPITAYVCAAPTNPFTGGTTTYECDKPGYNEVVQWDVSGTTAVPKRLAYTYMAWREIPVCNSCTVDVRPFQPVLSQDGTLVAWTSNYNQPSAPTNYQVFVTRVPQ